MYITPQEINNYYLFKKTNSPPSKVKLTSFLQKKQIIKNYYKNKILRYYLKKRKKENRSRKCFIIGNKLVLNNLEVILDKPSRVPIQY